MVEKDELTVTAFNLRQRAYQASCDGVQVQFSAPKNTVPFQDTNLTVMLEGLSPTDLTHCSLAKYAFPKVGMAQGHIEEATDGKDPVTVQSITGTYTPDEEVAYGYDVLITPLPPLPVAMDDDAQEKLDLEPPAEIDPEAMKPFKLRPASIMLKKVSGNDNANELDPMVDLKLMLKGLPASEAGRVTPFPWRLMNFTLQFVPQLMAK